MWGRRSSRTVVIGLAGAVFAVGCVLPIASLLLTSLGSATDALSLDARQWGLLANTARLGTGTALLAVAIGTPLGLVLARAPLPHKALLRMTLAAPVLLPPYIVALAWTYLGGNRGLVAAITGSDLLSAWTYSLPAAVLVLGLVFYPIAMLATEVAFRRIDGLLEEAALLVASPRRVFWRIAVPLAAPNIVAAGLVIFVLAASEFGVPGVLRVRVYTTEIFTAFAALYDPRRAAVLALPLIALCSAVTVVAVTAFGDRFVGGRRGAGRRRPFAWDTLAPSRPRSRSFSSQRWPCRWPCLRERRWAAAQSPPFSPVPARPSPTASGWRRLGRRSWWASRYGSATRGPGPAAASVNSPTSRSSCCSRCLAR